MNPRTSLPSRELFALGTLLSFGQAAADPAGTTPSRAAEPPAGDEDPQTLTDLVV